jgi:hypothetical protein
VATAAVPHGDSTGAVPAALAVSYFWIGEWPPRASAPEVRVVGALEMSQARGARLVRFEDCDYLGAAVAAAADARGGRVESGLSGIWAMAKARWELTEPGAEDGRRFGCIRPMQTKAPGQPKAF